MRNIEIKARATDFRHQTMLAEQLCDSDCQRLTQEDTFFQVPVGRLKLREFGHEAGELIQYDRDDTLEPTESRYLLCPTDCPATLKEALTNALGVRAVVRKERTVHFVGQTRIHFDDVEGLGQFIELEVVLKQDQTAECGAEIAENLMRELAIDRQDLIESAYVDLLERRPNHSLQEPEK